MDFYCAGGSNESQRVRPGCYVENERVKCTGAIPGQSIFCYVAIDQGPRFPIIWGRGGGGESPGKQVLTLK